MVVAAVAELYDLMRARTLSGGGSGGSGTDNYNALTNKPKINGVTLQGDKSLSDIGTYSKAEIDEKSGVKPAVIGENLIFTM